MLDDVIRQNRDMAQLILSSCLEVMELYAPITPSHPKEIINDWRFISLTLQNADISSTQVYLLGDKGSNGNARITSLVRKIDLDRQLVYTNSGSLYQLGTQGKGEPSQPQLYLICAAFCSWGFGTVLGIPPIFY